MKVNVYSETGKKKEAVNLPNSITSPANIAILTQAIRVFENRQHAGLARVKTRGEITASTHKIYKQKGTGGARHGAKSAPIFVGGGIAHGPTGNKRTLSMPAKMRTRALQVALGLKAKEGTLVIVEGVSKLTKTKVAQKLVDSIRNQESGIKNKARETKVVFALSEGNWGAVRYLRNLKNVDTVPYKTLNAYKVFLGGTIVVDSEAFSSTKDIAQTTEVKKEKKVKTETKKLK